MTERDRSTVDAVTLDASTLEAFASEVVRALGADDTVAQRVARSLVTANLTGHDSHGVLLLPFWSDLVHRGQIRPDARTSLVHDRGPVVCIDGNFGFGPAVAHEAVELARERGKRFGIASVGARNANHIARVGEYTSALAEQGLTSIMLVNTQGSAQVIPPYGGAGRRLTNNPISIAAPAEPHPVLVDMALSVVAEGKVWLAKARGEPVPEGWIQDRNGNPTSDPDELEAGGTLLPLGGETSAHKGYGLIVLIEILAGILTGGGVCREDAPEDFSNAFLLIAIDPEAFISRSEYAQQLELLRNYVTSAPRLPGVHEIRLPGDVETFTTEERTRTGIPIEASTWSTLGSLAEELGVDVPSAG